MYGFLSKEAFSHHTNKIPNPEYVQTVPTPSHTKRHNDAIQICVRVVHKEMEAKGFLVAFVGNLIVTTVADLVG